MKESYRQRAIRERLAQSQPARAAAPLSTGFPSLDAVTAGLPRGAIVELFGAPGGGKTTLALQIVAHLQACGGSAAWIDAEHCFDPGNAVRLGVSIDALPVAQPASAEEAFEIARRLAASAAVDLLIVDSAAALVPEIELDTAIGSGGAGLHTRVLASGLRRLAAAIRRSGAVVLFLNQARARGGQAGQEDTAAGGPPLKLFAALRLALSGEPAPGRPVRLRVLKNKAAAAPAECHLLWTNEARFVESP
jgi:recombination protein RecA